MSEARSKTKHASRKSLSKKLRFEVFKRDAFTCQYCGAKAPDVVLQADHIDPVANGGDNSITNLITSCFDCNSGKGARKLSDKSAVTKQRNQLEELEVRRQQLEMMLEWKKTLSDIDQDKVDGFVGLFEELTGYSLNDSAKQAIKRWVKKQNYAVLLEALEISCNQHLEFSEESPSQFTSASASKAFDKTPGIARVLVLDNEIPGYKDLLYTRGIMRNRLYYINENLCLEYLREAHSCDISIAQLQLLAREVVNWTDFENRIIEMIQENKDG